ncbi:DUF6508 domain-containing protein [Devosia sp. RR2S18]|uniref:DUF6508 domain-containing protein n=1 Tax=Devosia rhizosphaerae TaxID=3049774 RepID=UPI002540D1AF|nr:DUF6508 domain-containing protein [Devosia sp. RR2S18]WIJ25798.1 DUF6508 domain-containing protein [Devosia sp. RR2S18]
MPNTSLRIQRLAEFRTRLQDRDDFGELNSTPGSPAYVSLGDTGRDFIEMAYEAGWVEQDFHWMEWNGTAEAARLNRLEGVRTATETEMARVLTALIRGDRFNEGLLLGAFQTGLLTALSERAAVLDAEQCSK